MKWYIKDIEIKNQVVLAPMAGISNPTYIKILESMGLGLAFTELISAEAIIRDNKKTFEMLKGIEKINIPVGIQLFGSNIESLASAAKIITSKYKNAFIDINMGCPVPKIALKSEAGSALLKNPTLVGEIVSAVVQSVNVPVSVKIRSGWDDNSINAVEIAKIIEKNGASAISIHARTRKQGYSGKANWEIIKNVKDAVSIPVIGNGDVLSCFDALKMLNETGCDAVMIGRAFLGNPWLSLECVNYLDKGIIPECVNYNDKIDMMEKHLKMLACDKNEKLAVLEIRQVYSSYLKGLPLNKEIKNQLCKCDSVDKIISLLEDYRMHLKNHNDLL